MYICLSNSVAESDEKTFSIINIFRGNSNFLSIQQGNLNLLKEINI